MKLFKDEIKKQGFNIEFSGKIEQKTMSFQIQFYRIDNVDIDSIYPITSSLRIMAIKYNGDYDGWETSVETD